MQRVFFRKKQLNNYGQGTHSAKIGVDSLDENTPNTSKIIQPIFPIGRKVLDIVQKRLHKASLVCAYRQRSIGLGILPKKVRDDLNSRPLAHRCYSAFIITAS